MAGRAGRRYRAPDGLIWKYTFQHTTAQYPHEMWNAERGTQYFTWTEFREMEKDEQLDELIEGLKRACELFDQIQARKGDAPEQEV